MTANFSPPITVAIFGTNLLHDARNWSRRSSGGRRAGIGALIAQQLIPARLKRKEPAGSLILVGRPIRIEIAGRACRSLRSNGNWQPIRLAAFTRICIFMRGWGRPGVPKTGWLPIGSVIRCRAKRTCAPLYIPRCGRSWARRFFAELCRCQSTTPGALCGGFAESQGGLFPSIGDRLLASPADQPNGQQAGRESPKSAERCPFDTICLDVGANGTPDRRERDKCHFSSQGPLRGVLRLPPAFQRFVVGRVGHCGIVTPAIALSRSNLLLIDPFS
jgi:hypothetical protein